MFLRTVVAFAAVLFFGPATAHADSPYFTDTVFCAFPGGLEGQMRILRGDGLIAADPASVLVLDKDNRLLASVEASPSVFLSVDGASRCVALDPGERRVFEVDPGSFQAASAARVVRIDNGIPDFFPGDMLSSWGFTVRPMSLGENIVALFRLMVRRPLVPIVFTLLSIWAVRLCGSIIGQFRSDNAVPRRMIGVVVAAAGIVTLLALVLLSLAFGDAIPEIFLISFALGVAIYFAVRSLAIRLRASRFATSGSSL